MNLATLCATIATRDELEQLLVEQAADADRLRALNAELLAALQAIDQAENGPWDGTEQARYLASARKLVRAAIAKAQP